MALTITERPERELFVNNPPIQYETSYYTSRFNAVDRPNVYRITNDLFPVNSVDPSITDSTTSNGGLTQIFFPSHGLLAKDFIIVTNSQDTDIVPNGVFKVTSVTIAHITIDLIFNGTTYITVQKYYNNYNVVIRLFAGLPEYHTFQSQKVQVLIGTLKLIPDSTNEIQLDVAGLVRDQVNTLNDLDSINLPNDINGLTSYYIEFAEAFDVSDGFEITPFTSTFIEDIFEDCVGIGLINEEFATNLDNWTNNIVIGTENWIHDAGGGGNAEVTLPVRTNVSRWLEQAFSYKQGVQYTIDYSISGAGGYVVVIAIGDLTEPSGLRVIAQRNNAHSRTFSFIPYADAAELGFFVANIGTPSASLTVNMDFFRLTSNEIDPCRANIWATKSITQFQNPIGGNMGNFVMNPNQEVFLSLFLNKINKPALFLDHHFELDAIIPASTFSASINGDNLRNRLRFFEKGVELSVVMILVVDNLDDGIYRLLIDNEEINQLSFIGQPLGDMTGIINLVEFIFLTFVNQTVIIDAFTSQLFIIPQNLLIDADSGTFEDTSDPGGNPPSDWNVVINLGNPDIIGNGFIKFGSTGRTTGTVVDNISDFLVRFDSAITLLPDRDYIIECAVTITSLATVSGTPTSIFSLRPTGIPLADLSLQQVTFTAPYLTPPIGDTFVLRTVFNSGVAITTKVQLFLETTDVTVSFQWTIDMDNLTVKGPFENISEEKEVEVIRECANQEIQLIWEDSNGGWDTWVFTAEKEFSEEFSDIVQVKRDILQDFPNNFINNETQGDYLNIVNTPVIRVRSQFLDVDRITSIAEIKRSIKVQMFNADGTKTTVLVDKSKFVIRDEGDPDSLHQLIFDIRFPDQGVQRQ